MNRRVSLCAAVFALGLAAATPARATQVSQDTRVMMSDGVSVQATLTGEAPLAPRPVIVEFSPYGRNSGTTYDGPAYNYLLVQIRGTGDSDGRFDALGDRTQADVAQTLAWACNQPWSNGALGLNGFSASAITVYNSLHLSLPCVRTAVLKSGTHELYRDLLWPGGISNAVPGLGVLALIGGPATTQGLTRLQRNPASSVDIALGLFNAGLNGGLVHPTLDAWWQERGFRGEAQHLPILMIDGFFDVESRGAFQAYQRLRDDGAHLIVIGAHDGSPAGTDGGKGATKAWFDRYLLGAANGIDAEPRVQLWLADGSRESYLAGKFVRYDASDWPVAGTRWNSLWLDATPIGGGNSLFGKGSLGASNPAQTATQSYVSVPSIPSMSDTPNTALVGGFGLNSLLNALPQLTQTNLAEPLALTYTSKPLSSDMTSAGPASLELRMSSAAPETDIWAVVADVSPDGSSHPVATGRLRSSYPDVVPSSSLQDPQGDIVQPYGDYSHKTYTPALTERTYHVELWPIGNRFKQGDRIRLVILGPSAASLPSGIAVNTVRVGGPDGSRLLLPVLP
jgi:predicted acyl esterase